MGDAGLSNLKHLVRLVLLDLSNTRLSDAGLTHLTGLTNLRLLTLYHTQVTPAGVAMLGHALPNLKIDWFPVEVCRFSKGGELSRVSGIQRVEDSVASPDDAVVLRELLN